MFYWKYSGRRLYLYDKDDFGFRFDLNRESLITCKLVIRKNLVNNKTLKK